MNTERIKTNAICMTLEWTQRVREVAKHVMASKTLDELKEKVSSLKNATYTPEFYNNDDIGKCHAVMEDDSMCGKLVKGKDDTGKIKKFCTECARSRVSKSKDGDELPVCGEESKKAPHKACNLKVMKPIGDVTFDTCKRHASDKDKKLHAKLEKQAKKKGKGKECLAEKKVRSGKGKTKQCRKRIKGDGERCTDCEILWQVAKKSEELAAEMESSDSGKKKKKGKKAKKAADTDSDSDSEKTKKKAKKADKKASDSDSDSEKAKKKKADKADKEDKKTEDKKADDKKAEDKKADDDYNFAV